MHTFGRSGNVPEIFSFVRLSANLVRSGYSRTARAVPTKTRAFPSAVPGTTEPFSQYPICRCPIPAEDQRFPIFSLPRGSRQPPRSNARASESSRALSAFSTAVFIPSRRSSRDSAASCTMLTIALSLIECPNQWMQKSFNSR